MCSPFSLSDQYWYTYHECAVEGSALVISSSCIVMYNTKSFYA